MKSEKLRFVDKQGTDFFSSVRRNVDRYFEEKHLSKHADAAMVFKTVLLLSALVGLYLLIVLQVFPNLVLLLLAVMLGMVKAFIGFNICHDAIHGSYSSNSKVNKVLSLVFNLIGANAYVWDITHNKVHHTYTNIPGHDEDIDVAPGLIRISPEEPYKPFMKYQKYYAFLLYGLASISWVFRKDFKKFFQKQIGAFDNTKHPKIEYFNLFFYKALYYTLFIIIPLVVMEIAWWQFLIGFVIMHLAEGIVLGFVFQLAHVVEGTEFPYPGTEGTIENSWAVHQMQTTANFARKSKVVTFFCGGLNYQVEHHLFPKICHTHYPAISEIVKGTALEYNVPYNENQTFWGALKSHFVMLDKLGREPSLSNLSRA